MATKSPGGVQSVERVFEILELITDTGGEVTLSELAASTALPLPTIHRLLRTLVSLGYARQLPNRQYSLGPRLIRLGEQANRQLGTLALPELRRLVTTLGESANLATLDGDQVVYVAQAPSAHSMRMFTEVGRRAPLHNTGVGKALLADLPDDEVRAIVARTGMPTPTEFSIGTPEALLDELALIRERGYSIDEQEQEVGVRCYAMAVPGTPVPTAVSVSGPVSRVTEEFGTRAVPMLREVGAAIAVGMNAG
ncbi:IclR family transcriptional regulator [Paraoerskovia sediminicola]|uniref:IclR family transcriptional regulator n=1 Tax=Paraoerskovia sediminicola TaxID=1138587 RepID=A0ABN6XF85_9CELL|nr:IclR family transcriptional regulator [Paraoerskovia sediminicola]BDZ43445.1 IclR family transcriptional regulator [Paraoerskovia sediminicola]